MVTPVLLASGSPRRKEILTGLGIPVRVEVPGVSERLPRAPADEMTRTLSRRKAEAVQRRLVEAGEDWRHTLVVAADTAVVHRLRVLGKPKTRAAAADMLRRLQGKAHFVTTGLTLLYGERAATDSVLTRVTMAPMSEEEIAAYVKTGEPMDKAGGYAIQGLASLFVTGITGDYWNVVGFPVRRFYELLPEVGLSLADLVAP